MEDEVESRIRRRRWTAQAENDVHVAKMNGQKPWTIFSLMGLNILIYVIHLTNVKRPWTEPENSVLVPREFIRNPAAEWPRVMSAMFSHANLLHLVFNMAALYQFGLPLEHSLGGGRVLAIYMGSGLLTNVMYSLLYGNRPQGGIGIVGASAAISGLSAAYFLHYADRRNMQTWLAFQVAGAVLAAGSGISYISHLIGFGVGALIYFLIRPTGGKDNSW
jgi:membrane associated rhomboid family serine protease